MHKRRGFTLVELLVVIGIVVLLAGILIPVLGKARARANRTRCAAQLQDIGRMLQMYFGENKNTLPHVNQLPSLRPPLNNYPDIVDALASYDRRGARVFQCPSDKITQLTENTAPTGSQTYFSREHSSYRWNSMVNILAKRITDLRKSDNTVLLDEYEPFHGPPGGSGSMNHLFADAHVGDADGNLVIIVK
jgi:prepilin-type N-terminal cleavage/methylation domain-containing protein